MRTALVLIGLALLLVISLGAVGAAAEWDTLGRNATRISAVNQPFPRPIGMVWEYKLQRPSETVPAGALGVRMPGATGVTGGAAMPQLGPATGTPAAPGYEAGGLLPPPPGYYETPYAPVTPAPGGIESVLPRFGTGSPAATPRGGSVVPYYAMPPQLYPNLYPEPGTVQQYQAGGRRLERAGLTPGALGDLGQPGLGTIGPGLTATTAGYSEGQEVPAFGPVTDGRYLFAVAGHRIYAIDAATGAEVARFDGDAYFMVAPTVAATGVGPNGDERIILIGDTEGTLHALSLLPSQKELGTKWTWEVASAGIYSAVCVVGDMAFVGADDGYLYALQATDPEWGNVTLLWSQRTGGGIKAAPAYWRGLVYFISGDLRLYAVDGATGMPRWQFSTGRGLGQAAGLGVVRDAVSSATLAAPVVANDKVYVARSRYLYAVSADSGMLRWRFVADDDIVGSPAVSGRWLVVATQGGNVYCLHANTGQQLWRWRTVGGERFGAPPAATNDVVVARSMWGTLYALSLESGEQLWLYKLKEIPATAEPQPGAGLGRAGPGAGGLQTPAGGGLRGISGPGAAGRAEKRGQGPLQVAARLEQPSADSVQYFQRRRAEEGGLGPAGMGVGTNARAGTLGGARTGLGALTGAARLGRSLFTFEEMVSPAPIFSGQRLYVISNDYTLCAFGPDGMDGAPPLALGSHIQVPGDEYMYAYQLPLLDPKVQLDTPLSINGQGPIYLSFYVFDEGSGVDPDSIRLTRNGIPEETKFRPEDGTVWYILEAKGQQVLVDLEEGTYDFVLSVSDWFGNAVTKKVVIEVDYSTPGPTAAATTAGRGPVGTRAGVPGGPTAGGGATAAERRSEKK